MTLNALVSSKSLDIKITAAEKGPNTLPTDIKSADVLSFYTNRSVGREDIVGHFPSLKITSSNDNRNSYREYPTTSLPIKIRNTVPLNREIAISNKPLLKITSSNDNRNFYNEYSTSSTPIKISNTVPLNREIPITSKRINISGSVSEFNFLGSNVDVDLLYTRINSLSSQGAVVDPSANVIIQPNVSGLIATYDGTTFSSNTWSDRINSYHPTITAGTPNIASGTLNGRPIIEGSPSDKILFPVEILPTTYTLFHVARIRPAGQAWRMFQGSGNNWLSGFWNGYEEVAYHVGWLTPQTTTVTNNWVISTDMVNLYRANGVTKGTSGGTANTRLSVNSGDFPLENSDFQIAEILVFNRELTSVEYAQVEQYLSFKYSLPLNGTVASDPGFGFSAEDFGIPKLTTTHDTQTITYTSFNPVTKSYSMNNISIPTSLGSQGYSSTFNTQDFHMPIKTNANAIAKSYPINRIGISTAFGSQEYSSTFNTQDFHMPVKTNTTAQQFTTTEIKKINIGKDFSFGKPVRADSIQFSFYTQNVVPLGFFDVNGVQELKELTKTNDPRLNNPVLGVVSDGGGDNNAISGPVQAWGI